MLVKFPRKIFHNWLSLIPFPLVWMIRPSGSGYYERWRPGNQGSLPTYPTHAPYLLLALTFNYWPLSLMIFRPRHLGFDLQISWPKSLVTTRSCNLQVPWPISLVTLFSVLGGSDDTWPSPVHVTFTCTWPSLTGWTHCSVTSPVTDLIREYQYPTGNTTCRLIMSAEMTLGSNFDR